MDPKTKIDKKSIIQIVILLLLVAVGAGAYLTSQEGGLDVSSIVGSILGEPEPSPPPPPPKPRSRREPKPAASTIPAQPAKGEIGGTAFEPDSVAFEGGVLAFVQGKEPQSAVLIRVAAPKWQTPVGKKFKYQPAGANSPLVSVTRMEGGEMKSQQYAADYTLLLEFGKEQDRKLAGKLLLEVPGAQKVKLGGTFDAEIKGFRIIDGKPDLTADSTDTLEYLALRRLLEDDPEKQINVTAFRDGRYSADPVANNHVGYLEVEYRVAESSSELKRFQFVKDNEWKIRDTLALDQIDEAHPIKAPGPRDEPEQLLSYLAAKRLEADVKKKSPKKGVYGVGFVTRYSAKNKIGAVEARYQTEPDGQALKTAYLFRLKKGGWALDRELTSKERVNVETGNIEKR